MTEQRNNIFSEEAAKAIASVTNYTLPITAWIGQFIKPYIVFNNRISKEYARQIVMYYYDNVYSIFYNRNFFTTQIFFKDLDIREVFGRTWWINVFGEAGTGKSLWGLKFFLLYDDDKNYWKTLLRRQVTADSSEFQMLVSNYSKYHDVYLVFWEYYRKKRGVFIDNDTWFRKFKAWLEANERISSKVGSRTLYYDGMNEMELSAMFAAAVSYWTGLGYVYPIKDGVYELSMSKKYPRKVFILDEALKKYGAGSLIMSDSLKNMVKVSRVKNINFVFCGVVQERRLPFTYVLLAEEGLYDSNDLSKLRVLKAGVHYPVRYGGESGYDRIGTAVTFAPPDIIIKEYLKIEREVAASAEIGGLGFTDYARMKLMARFSRLQDTTELVDAEEVVELLIRDDDFKFLQKLGRLTWNRIKPIVERIVRNTYDVTLTSGLWDRIRFEIEKRGLK